MINAVEKERLDGDTESLSRWRKRRHHHACGLWNNSPKQTSINKNQSQHGRSLRSSYKHGECKKCNQREQHAKCIAPSQPVVRRPTRPLPSSTKRPYPLERRDIVVQPPSGRSIAIHNREENT